MLRIAPAIAFALLMPAADRAQAAKPISRPDYIDLCVRNKRRATKDLFQRVLCQKGRGNSDQTGTMRGSTISQLSGPLDERPVIASCTLAKRAVLRRTQSQAILDRGRGMMMVQRRRAPAGSPPS